MTKTTPDIDKYDTHKKDDVLQKMAPLAKKCDKVTLFGKR